MRYKVYIPELVKQTISKHINAAIKKSVRGYSSANEEEDTLMGHLGALLKIENQKVYVTKDNNPGMWRWLLGTLLYGQRMDDKCQLIIQ